MKIFLDANILVAVLCNEYPLITYCSRVLSLADNPKFGVYTSPLCLAIAFYFSEKKDGTALAQKKIKVLSEKLNVTTIDANTVRLANQNKSIHDFEDGLEYYSAIDSNCQCIITEDKSGFYFSKIEALGAEEFLVRFVVGGTQ